MYNFPFVLYKQFGFVSVPTGYTARMAGFFLYVSNTTSKDDGHLCFHEIQTVNRTPSEDQRVNCSVHGRYVIYYNERKENVTYPDYYSDFAYYELCELEVYGEFSKKIILKVMVHIIPNTLTYVHFVFHISQIRCVLIIVYLILKYIGCIKNKSRAKNSTDCEHFFTQIISQSHKLNF